MDKDAAEWYTILRYSLESTNAKRDEVLDLICNKDSLKACLGGPKLPHCWRTRPGKVITVLGKDPLKGANKRSSMCWLGASDLYAEHWS